MSIKNNVIRFAVGDKNDLRSSVWRLWANGNDLYLGARSFAHISKFSFHQSGINRYAINESVWEKEKKTDRVLYRWKRANEIQLGWTRCLGILIPPRMTKRPFQNISEKTESVKFIKPPRKKEKIIFNILFSHKAAKPEHVIRNSTDKITVHGCVQMSDELAWVTYFYEKVSKKELAVTQDHFDKLKLHVKPNTKPEQINRTFLHILQEGITPFLIDIELGEENVEVE